MRAAALRSGTIYVRDDVARARAAVRAGAGTGQGVRDLRLGPALRPARRRDAGAGHRDRGDARPRCARGRSRRGRLHGPRVLGRGDRGGPRHSGARGGHARHVDPDPAVDDRHSPDRLQQRRRRRVRRADAALGADAARGAQRARRRSGRADRADGRRAARGEPVGDHAGRGRAGARLRAGRARGDRGAQAEGRRARSWRPTSRRPVARIATAMGAHEVVDPREEPAFDAWRRSGGHARRRGVRGDRRAGHHRRASCGGARARARIVVVGVCMQPDAIHPFFGIARS